MKRTALLIAEQLHRWGIHHLFGIPGKPVVPFILAAEDSGITFVLSRHEGGAGYEAAGYAMQVRGLGAAVGTSGPGATNMLTAAAQAKASGLPVLFFTGHPSAGNTGKPQGQDSSFFGTDTEALFKPVTKFSAQVERADQVGPMLLHAVKTAVEGVPGPVHLSIPADVLMAEAEPFSYDMPEPDLTYSLRIKEFPAAAVSARRPVLLLGKGVHTSGAYSEVRAFAELYQLPVMTTPGGKGTFPDDHSLSLGAFGLGGTEQAHAYIEQGTDLLIVCGSSLSDMSVAGWKPEHYPERIIHFDARQHVTGMSFPRPSLTIAGDLRLNLQQLLRLEAVPASPIHLPAVQKPEDRRGGRWLSAGSVMDVLNEMLPDRAFIYGDDGSHTFYAIQRYIVREPGHFFFDDVFGAMGHGIGYAVGAAFADPDADIVCLTGDGCMFMHGAEVSTAVSGGAALLFIVINNQALDMVDKGMKVNIGRAAGTTYEKPLHATSFAESLGADAYRIDSEDGLRSVMKNLFPLKQTTVLEVMTDPDEIPPTMRRG
ncbi:thiamine pyrophosphate-binding protein [Bacillus daqingensis]|uniref:Thiamine pyrophosphate-binding protein n=1 Tax=Bacillus daqingensis TaxID=872396 RepID=A0ABV9NVS1_9BACI